MSCQDLVVDDIEPAAPTVARRNRGRIIGAGIVAAAVALGSLAFFRMHGESGLPHSAPGILNTLDPMKRGTIFNVTDYGITDKGKDIEILDIEVLKSPNLEYLGAVAIWPRDIGAKGNPGNTMGFPDRPSHHEALNTVIPAAELDVVPPRFDRSGDLFVQLGFRVASGDVAALNGIRITYRVGKKIKHEYSDMAVIACIEPNPCRSAPKAALNSFEQQTLVGLGLVSRHEYDS